MKLWSSLPHTNVVGLQLPSSPTIGHACWCCISTSQHKCIEGYWYTCTILRGGQQEKVFKKGLKWELLPSLFFFVVNQAISLIWWSVGGTTTFLSCFIFTRDVQKVIQSLWFIKHLFWFACGEFVGYLHQAIVSSFFPVHIRTNLTQKAPFLKAGLFHNLL